MNPKFNIPPSAEGQNLAATEFIIAEDWGARLYCKWCKLTSFTAESGDERDPVRQAELVVRAEEALLSTLGSGALTLFKRDVLAGQAAFENEFAW